MHIAKESLIPDQCISHALSVQGQSFTEACHHGHSSICQDCEKMDMTLKQIQRLAEEQIWKNKEATMFVVCTFFWQLHVGDLKHCMEWFWQQQKENILSSYKLSWIFYALQQNCSAFLIKKIHIIIWGFFPCLAHISWLKCYLVIIIWKWNVNVTSPFCSILQEDLFFFFATSKLCKIICQSSLKVDEAVSAIHKWKAHILRSKNQERARTCIIDKMTEGGVLVTCDWAMKFLPRKYREGMRLLRFIYSQLTNDHLCNTNISSKSQNLWASILIMCRFMSKWWPQIGENVAIKVFLKDS